MNKEETEIDKIKSEKFPRRTKREGSSKERITVYSAYGYGNLGDEAILAGMLSRLKDKKVLVFSGAPNETSKIHRVPSTYVNPLCLLSTDRLIIGGGGILFDAYAHYFLSIALIALILNVKVEFHSIGVDKMNRRLPKLLVPFVLNRANFISVRDETSKKNLISMNVKKNIKVVGDPATYLKEIPYPDVSKILAGEGIKKGERLIGVSLKFMLSHEKNKANVLESKELLKKSANMIDWLIKKYDAKIIFIPMCKHKKWFENDITFAEKLYSMIKNKKDFIIPKGTYSPQEIRAILAKTDLLIGMRLHALVLATLSSVPFIGISYDQKVTEFAKKTGAPLFDAGTMDIEEIKKSVMRLLPR